MAASDLLFLQVRRGGGMVIVGMLFDRGLGRFSSFAARFSSFAARFKSLAARFRWFQVVSGGFSSF